MNSIPRGLLNHPAIETRYGTRIKTATLATLQAGEGEGGGEGTRAVWELQSAQGDGMDGLFDAMVLSDRLMGAKPQTTAVGHAAFALSITLAPSPNRPTAPWPHRPVAPSPHRPIAHRHFPPRCLI